MTSEAASIRAQRGAAGAVAAPAPAVQKATKLSEVNPWVLRAKAALSHSTADMWKVSGRMHG